MATAGESQEKNQSIEARLGQLESASMESAQLLQEMAQQVQALTIAQEQTARRARIGLALGITASIVGVGAGILALVW
jgi:hypothetical protein